MECQNISFLQSCGLGRCLGTKSRRRPPLQPATESCYGDDERDGAPHGTDKNSHHGISQLAFFVCSLNVQKVQGTTVESHRIVLEAYVSTSAQIPKPTTRKPAACVSQTHKSKVATMGPQHEPWRILGKGNHAGF